MDHFDIDGLCEAYESTWTAQRCGKVRVLEFLAEHQRDPSQDIALLSSIVSVDIERAWLHWRQRLKLAAPQEAKQLLSDLQMLPTLADYKSWIECHGCDKWAETAQSECEARNAWGDAIGVQHYQHEYGIQVKSIEHPQRRYVELKTEHDAKDCSMRFPVQGSMILGRQTSADQGPYVLHEEQLKRRLTIANRLEDRVSRQQLELQLLSPEYAILTNRGRANSVYTGGGYALPAGEPVLLQFPFRLIVAHAELLFS